LQFTFDNNEELTMDEIEKLLEFGHMDLEAGYPQYAREYFEKVLALDAANPEALDGLARVDEILRRQVSFKPTKPEEKPVQPQYADGIEVTSDHEVSFEPEKPAEPVIVPRGEALQGQAKRANEELRHKRRMEMQLTGLDLLLKAFDVSFDWRKLGFTILGLVVTFVAASPFLWIAAEVDNTAIGAIFMLIMLVVVWVLLTLVTGTVSKLSYEDMRGRRMDVMDALRFTARHIASLLFSPLVLWIGIGVVILVEVILLFVGRIPVLGEIWASLIFLPLFVLNLFLVLLGFLGGWLGPFVVVGEETGVLDTLSRLVEIVRHAPGRLMAYLGMTLFLIAVAVWPLIILVYGAFYLTGGLTMIGLGEEKVTGILLAGLLKWLDAVPLGELLGEFLRLGWRYGYGVEVGASFTLASWIYSFSLVVILAAIYAFFIVFPLSCGCAIYISVRAEAPVEAVPREPVMKRYCIKCGAEVPPDAQFCTKCGAPQTGS
jgi:ribosomal protein L40E